MSSTSRAMPAHSLPPGDEAGPTLYALHGVGPSLDRNKRPFGWEDDFDLGAVRAPMIQPPLTTWSVDGPVLNTGGDVSAQSAAAWSSVPREHVTWADRREGWTVAAQRARFRPAPVDIEVAFNTCRRCDRIRHKTNLSSAWFAVQKRKFAVAISPPPWAPHYDPELGFNLVAVRDRREQIDGNLSVTDEASVRLLDGLTPGTQVGRLEIADRACMARDFAISYARTYGLTSPESVLPS